MKMMKKVLNGIMVTTISATAFFFQACENDEEVKAISQEEEADIVVNSSTAENSVDVDVQVVDEILATTASSTGRIAQEVCATVTRDEAAKIITIDFGASCIGRYGKERSGKVIVTYGGTFGDSLANRVITFENYFVNNLNITGSIELRDFNRNNAGNIISTRRLTDYTINYPDGESFVLNGSTTREWIQGEGDGIFQNNVFSITGSYTGITRRNREFTHTITVPIIADFNCRASGGFLRISGEKEMTIKTVDAEKVRIIAFGDGTCDNTISITINGKTYTISVSK